MVVSNRLCTAPNDARVELIVVSKSSMADKLVELALFVKLSPLAEPASMAVVVGAAAMFMIDPLTVMV